MRGFIVVILLFASTLSTLLMSFHSEEAVAQGFDFDFTQEQISNCPGMDVDVDIVCINFPTRGISLLGDPDKLAFIL